MNDGGFYKRTPYHRTCFEINPKSIKDRRLVSKKKIRYEIGDRG